MIYQTSQGLLLLFIGTTVGAACVFFLKNNAGDDLRRLLSGLSAGVMEAASVFSLLLPSVERAEELFGKLAFLPAVGGFAAGIFLFALLDGIEQKKQRDGDKTTLLIFAIVVHNIPEGMAVGAAFSAAAYVRTEAAVASAFMLAVGIAIQNFPEGAIISLPLAANGTPKPKAFFRGLLSGLVEPAAGLLTFLLSRFLVPALPALLSFAAGAMIYVVTEELIPEMGTDKKKALTAFTAGFALMMSLDVALAN